MDPFMCVNCRKKTYSNVSDQVDRIVRVLRDAGYLSDSQNTDESRDAFGFVAAMTMSTSEKCQFGLYCPTLSQKKVTVDHKIQRIAGNVLSYVKTLDFNGLQNFLQYFCGYFPAGYKWVENYWKKNVGQC